MHCCCLSVVNASGDSSWKEEAWPQCQLIIYWSPCGTGNLGLCHFSSWKEAAERAKMQAMLPLNEPTKINSFTCKCIYSYFTNSSKLGSICMQISFGEWPNHWAKGTFRNCTVILAITTSTTASFNRSPDLFDIFDINNLIFNQMLETLHCMFLSAHVIPHYSCGDQ